MRIAVWYYLASGGARRALHQYVKGLTQRGHQIEAWCPPTADRSFLPLTDFIEEHVVPLNTVFKISRNPLAQPFRDRLYTEAQHDALVEHCSQCAKQINRGKFDLLFAHPSSWFFVPPIGRFISIPKILYLQEPNRLLYEAIPELPWSAPDLPSDFYLSPRKLRRWIADALRVDGLRLQVREEKRSALSYDLILVNSYFSRESVMRAYGLSSTFARLGIDTDLFRPQGLVRDNSIVGLGSLTFTKGIDTAIETVAKLPTPRPTLIWISNFGNDDYQRDLQQLAAKLGVELEIKRRIADEEVVRVLNSAKALLYTSRLEPFGYAPLEANACGTPVVAVAEGGVRETVIDGLNGFLADRNPEALAQALLRLITDPHLADKMGTRAITYVRENWSLDRSIDTLETIFHEFLMSRLSNIPPF